MGGHENGMVLILDKIQEHIQDIIPHHRVKTACGLIQNEEFWVMGEGGCDAELHFHSF